ncbi:MAG: hypothetical protein L0F95_09855 [Lactococcus sp.]|uniref:hypothetical protein n=1 Tax=Pseudolactococcus carnosus TaxID=2749961 RepID=UPI001FBAA457|nr:MULTISPECIES: hypothetical protein [Lactococcus]MBR6896286.1 hypothetical protein [Lactococcus sp.]MCJ2003235.1 hypothetical protein [Lactococcus carnosus]MDN5403806.1 hypothetical protein [Lactococcus sp.]MDN5409229.1 hypothetical protein [Lactococcus sp.]MDN5412694.1 hypothetical protein [Lactococcus sp.]
MEKYERKTLNQSANYILAVSSINLVDLIAAQKRLAEYSKQIDELTKKLGK